MLRKFLTLSVFGIFFFQLSKTSACAFKPSYKGDSVVCAGSIVNYKTTKTLGHYYRWVIRGAGTIISGQGTDSITISWPVSGSAILKLVDSIPLACIDSVVKTVKIGVSTNSLNKTGYSLVGSATVSGKTYSVTTNGTSQVGAAWNKSRISLYQNFDFTFNVSQCGSADGMLFVIQNTGLSAIGGSSGAGSALGYYDGASGTFDQSIGIEFDIYKSPAGYSDSSGGHLALVKNKSVNPVKKQFDVH